jgi:outer membrane protein assembly factor BamB
MSAIFFCALLQVASAQSKSPGVDVLTQRYDIARTGANLRETSLNPKTISTGTFGKLFERAVDGDIYAQPLIKTGVNVPGVGVRNVVYVATVNNSLYAFDADTPEAGRPLWHVTRQVFGNPVPKAEVTDLPPDQKYLNFESTIGIVATPVIDDQTNTIYVVAQSKMGAEYRFRLHAFDIASGREKTELHSPVKIDASYLGNGVGSSGGRIEFRPRKMLNRPALLLLDGVLYLAFTAHLDGEPKFDYHGWVLAYDAKTLGQISALCTTPDGVQGGIWQSGTGLAAERREGTIPLVYAVSSNGSVGGRNYAQSILQLYPGELLSLKLAFTPANHAYQNDRDLDLSTGPVLLPDLPLIVACSKEGKCYVVDRSTLRIVQELQAAVNSYGGERSPNIHGAPVLWRNPDHKLRMYVWGEEDYLRAFQFDGRKFVGAGKSTFAAPAKSMPGGMLTLSANGDTAGSAVLWASIPVKDDANIATVEGIVRAFDAENVEKELWNSGQNAGRDRLGMHAKFCPPVVANGKLYVATFRDGAAPNMLVVYGILSGGGGPCVSSR